MTDAIFAVRQLMEKHREKQKELHMVFIDLEKAYDRVPRQEVWRCMREKGVQKYVTIVQDMYEGARTRVKSSVGLTDMIPWRIHQGSSLSPYLFAMIMDKCYPRDKTSILLMVHNYMLFIRNKYYNNSTSILLMAYLLGINITIIQHPFST